MDKYNYAPEALAAHANSTYVGNVIGYAGAEDCSGAAGAWKGFLLEKAEEVRRQRAANALNGVVSQELASLLPCDKCGSAQIDTMGRIICGLPQQVGPTVQQEAR